VVAAETEREKGVCLYKQETRVDAYGGLFQNHRQNFGVEQSLIRRFKLAILYSPIDKLRLGVSAKALKPSVGVGSRLHPISQ